MNPSQKAGILSEALPYLRAFHGKTLVIRFGGHAMADPALKAGFARDVALLRLVGMKPIVVHGGGWGIDELMKQMGQESRRYRGHRITDERTLNGRRDGIGRAQPGTDVADQSARRTRGRARTARTAASSTPARWPAPADDPDAPDLGFVGDVESIDTALIELLLSRNFVPVIMPIGVAADGTTLPHQLRHSSPAGSRARSRPKSWS